MSDIVDLDYLYNYLRRECINLEAAKEWIAAWANEHEQVLPWDKEAVYTMRAMAGHVSNVLEGGTSETGYARGGSSYFDTKYGSELFHAINDS